MTTTDKTKALLAASESIPPWWVDSGRYIKDNSQQVFYVADMAGTSLWAESNAALIVHLRNVAEHYVAVAEAAQRLLSFSERPDADLRRQIANADAVGMLFAALDALDAAGGDDAKV